MNKVLVIIITIITLSLVSPLLSVTSIQAQEPQQKFFIVIKAHSTDSHDEFKADNIISTNLQSTVLKNNYNNKPNIKIEYDLNRATIVISNETTYWTLPFKIIDTSTPNIIRIKNVQIGTGINALDYTREFNTQTKIATYTGNTGVTDSERNGFNVSDFSIKATVYPNGTAIIDTRMTNG